MTQRVCHITQSIGFLINGGVVEFPCSARRVPGMARVGNSNRRFWLVGIDVAWDSENDFHEFQSCMRLDFGKSFLTKSLCLAFQTAADTMPKSVHPFLHDVFLNYAHEVTAFLSRRWPKEQDIADIVQESFLRLSQYPEPEAIRNPRAFLFQTAANLAVDRHRRAKIREQCGDHEAEAETVADSRLSPHHYWEAREALDHLSRWLDELPELQRHAFILYRLEGSSHAEIAVRLGVSVRCSERYVRLAMQHISKRMDALSP